MKGNAAKFPSKREGKTHFTFPDVSSIGFDKKEGPPIDEIVGGNDVDPPRKYKVRRYQVPKSPISLKRCALLTAWSYIIS